MITFGGGHNEASGGAGNDYILMYGTTATIEGGAGDDRLRLMADVSTVLYDGVENEGTDFIMIFTTQADILRISNMTFDDLLIEKAGVDTKITLLGGTEITPEEVGPNDLTIDNFEFV